MAELLWVGNVSGYAPSATSVAHLTLGNNFAVSLKTICQMQKLHENIYLLVFLVALTLARIPAEKGSKCPGGNTSVLCTGT